MHCFFLNHLFAHAAIFKILYLCSIFISHRAVKGIRDARCRIGQIQTLMQLLLFEKMIFIIFFTD